MKMKVRFVKNEGSFYWKWKFVLLKMKVRFEKNESSFLWRERRRNLLAVQTRCNSSAVAWNKDCGQRQQKRPPTSGGLVLFVCMHYAEVFSIVQDENEWINEFGNMMHLSQMADCLHDTVPTTDGKETVCRRRGCRQLIIQMSWQKPCQA